MVRSVRDGLENMSLETNTLDQLKIDRAAARPRGSRAWLVIVIVVLLLLGGGVAWWMQRPVAAVVRTVAVRETASGGQRTLLNASGYVTARREATVSSKVTGKVIEVMIEEGMKVEAGQILARIDASNVQANSDLVKAQLAAARSSLTETRVRVDEAERELQRMTKLESQKIATQADWDRADATLKSWKARLERQTADVTVAESEVALWKQQLDDTVIRAPFSGIVTSKNAQPGEMISPMSAGGSFTRTGICTIVDMGSLEMEVDVNESYINRVESGQPVQATLDSYGDWKIPAKVIAIIPTADRQKATVKVRVGFDKLDPRILPHMGVKVAFQSTDDGQAVNRSIGVPKSAVRQREGRDIVWVVRDGKVERRAVTTGGVTGDEVVIAAGLSGGEKVVIEGPSDLAEGNAVKEAKK